MGKGRYAISHLRSAIALSRYCPLPSALCHIAIPLEEPNRPPLPVDVDVHEGRRLAEAWHPLHVSAQGNHEAGARARHEASDRQHESCGTVAECRLMRERQVRLGHAHGRAAETDPLDALEILD